MHHSALKRKINCVRNTIQHSTAGIAHSQITSNVRLPQLSSLLQYQLDVLHHPPVAHSIGFRRLTLHSSPHSRQSAAPITTADFAQCYWSMNKETEPLDDGSSGGEDRKPAANGEEGDDNQDESIAQSGKKGPRKRGRGEESVQSLTVAAAAPLSAGMTLQEKWDEMYNRLKRYKVCRLNSFLAAKTCLSPLASHDRNYKAIVWSQTDTKKTLLWVHGVCTTASSVSQNSHL